VVRKEEQTFRIRYWWLLRLGKLILVLVCLTGGFFLLGHNSKGFGILLLLGGFWLILDSRHYLTSSIDPFCNNERSKAAESDSRAVEGSSEHATRAEPLVIRPEGTLDLHTFSPEDVPSLLDEFIHLSREDGIYLVKIIHGKGTGSLRRWVHKLLDVDPRVEVFYDAVPTSGGWGATVVELRPTHDTETETTK